MASEEPDPAPSGAEDGAAEQAAAQLRSDNLLDSANATQTCSGHGAAPMP